MSVKKSPVKGPKNPIPKPAPAQEPPPTAPEPKSPPPKPPEKPKPLTLNQLHQELQSLRQLVDEHSNLMKQLQEILIRKRKPVTSNGKVQIRDKQTGTVYPSKNNAYQSLLKSGELKELVDKGVFGDNPQKNTFGWYVLVKQWPDRFEEVKPEEDKA